MLPSAARDRALHLALLWTSLAAVSLARDPGAVLQPILAFEDGRDVFGFFYHQRSPGSWLRAHAGYVVLVPNLFGWLALALPITAAPVALALLPLTLATTAFAWLARPAYRSLEPSDAARAALCVLLAAAPLTNHRYLSSTMYAVWACFLLLCWWTLAPPPVTGRRAVVRWLGMTLLIASHALSAVLLPVYVALALWGDRIGPGAGRPRPLQRRFYAALAGSALLYQLVGVERAPQPPPAIAEALHHTLVFFLERVVFGALAGDQAARALRLAGHSAWIHTLAIVAVTAGALAVHRARRLVDPPARFALLFGLWVMFAVTAAVVVGRQPGLDILGTTRGSRFFWIQKIVCVATFAFAARLAWRARVPRAASDRKSRGRQALAAGLAFAWIVWLHLGNLWVYRVAPEPGRAVREFARTLAERERGLGGRAGVEARLERGKWSIEISQRRE